MNAVFYLGLFVSLVSYFMGDRLLLFFYIGLGMIAYGVIKFLMVRPEKKVKKNKQTNPLYVKCSKCGNVLRSDYNYCYNCGIKQ